MTVLASLGAKSGATRRFAGAMVVGLGLVIASQAPSSARGPESVADIAEELLDAVVNISTSQTVSGSRNVPAPSMPDGSPFQDFFDEFFDQRQDEDRGSARPRRVQSLGSGFVIDSSGVIITNNHVIDGADEITVNFADGSKLTATLVGRDEKTDLAVLKVEPEEPLTALEFGDSEVLRVGDWVMAIGNPFGLGGTVTVGIVSARNRDINSGPYDNFIQTDASINRGNSGGPLFDMEGRVIGINTAIISPTGGSIGIGFAVPSSTAVNVIQQLRDFGETRRGWLGVRIQEVTDDIAEGLSMVEAAGALVAGVTDPGPAAEAGIAPGDVIVKFNGRPVAAMHELPRMVADEPVGKEVEIVVIRKGAEQSLKVKLGRLEEAEAAEVAALAADEAEPEPEEPAVVTGPLGLTLSDLSPAMRSKFGIKDEINGVVVTDVVEGSAAEEKRVQAGDVILEISQEAVDSPAAIEERINQLKTDGRKSALLLLANKNGDLRFVAVNIE
ncbi:Do family serine endopeptidase [Bauldia litoralis]|uniref:Probable periplasmic serine endoprotease DegP-like n=1 Tax=Bauldia litoralis TaxID=665467 RepID=A0A1G6D4Q5_9HYPH|nr:serine protease Do [Bauldia litoralis]